MQNSTHTDTCAILELKAVHTVAIKATRSIITPLGVIYAYAVEVNTLIYICNT